MSINWVPELRWDHSGPGPVGSRTGAAVALFVAAKRRPGMITENRGHHNDVLALFNGINETTNAMIKPSDHTVLRGSRSPEKSSLHLTPRLDGTHQQDIPVPRAFIWKVANIIAGSSHTAGRPIDYQVFGLTV
jgi:hypothetical protein